MTLFLIVALIVLVISFSQSVNNGYANDQYRQSTITNVKLERQLKDEWREKIDKKIDELNPPVGEMFTTLISLYNYYDVPLYGLVIGSIADAEKRLEETKVKAKEDETYAAKNLYCFDEFGFAVHDLSFPVVIYEYEKENLAQEEKEQIVQQLQGLLKEKKRRFSLRRYLGKSFQNAAFMNC